MARARLPLDTIVLGDCLEGMRRIPDACVDLAFADPPFNLGKRYGVYDDRRGVQEYFDWCASWLREMARVLKPTGSLFVYNIPRSLVRYAALLDADPAVRFRHWIAWEGRSTPLGKTLQPTHYGILWYVRSEAFTFHEIRGHHACCRECGAILKDYGGKKDQMHPFGPLVGDVWTDIHRVRHNLRRDPHPCQLPVPLVERLLLMCTEAGGIVLDPFMGTGTTAVAARRLGRHFVGFDVDPAYVKIATEKAAREKPTRLGGDFVSVYLGKLVTVRDDDFPAVAASLETRPIRVREGHSVDHALPHAKLVSLPSSGG